PAKALHQQEHFNWVIDYLKKSDPNRFLFFDCIIFSLVEGSTMETQCRNLLRTRWQGVSSILLPTHDDRDIEVRPRGALSRASGRLARLRNRQVVVIFVLVCLIFVVIIATTLAR